MTIKESKRIKILEKFLKDEDIEKRKKRFIKMYKNLLLSMSSCITDIDKEHGIVKYLQDTLEIVEVTEDKVNEDFDTPIGPRVDGLIEVSADFQVEVIEELKAQISQTDKEIDQMVYELYDLTPVEIEIIENSTK